MTAIGITWDVKPFLGYVDKVLIRQLPYATSQALNDAMFAIVQGWGAEMRAVFNNPTPLTLSSIRYKKASKAKLFAEIFLRDEAVKGTPPNRYLAPEVYGGARRPKPVENLLRSAGVLGATEYVVPARGFPVDAFGNIQAAAYRRIISDVQASRDPTANSTRASRGKRSRRKNQSQGQVYFYNRGTRGKLPRGIYERRDNFVGPSKGAKGGLRMALKIIGHAPQYHIRFDAREIAQRLFDRTFPSVFQRHLARAIINDKGRERPLG